MKLNLVGTKRPIPRMAVKTKLKLLRRMSCATVYVACLSAESFGCLLVRFKYIYIHIIIPSCTKCGKNLLLL